MMVCHKIIEILTILCIINTTIAYDCWCCSSDESDSQFCGKVLDESKLSKYQLDVNLVRCTYPPHEHGRDRVTKCMIQKTSKHGEIVYSRSCIFEDVNVKNDSCLHLPPPLGHRMVACETCMGDKCNYALRSDSGSESTHQLVISIMFICLVIVLKI